MKVKQEGETQIYFGMEMQGELGEQLFLAQSIESNEYALSGGIHTRFPPLPRVGILSQRRRGGGGRNRRAKLVGHMIFNDLNQLLLLYVWCVMWQREEMATHERGRSRKQRKETHSIRLLAGRALRGCQSETALLGEPSAVSCRPTADPQAGEAQNPRKGKRK